MTDPKECFVGVHCVETDAVPKTVKSGTETEFPAPPRPHIYHEAFNVEEWDDDEIPAIHEELKESDDAELAAKKATELDTAFKVGSLRFSPVVCVVSYHTTNGCQMVPATTRGSDVSHQAFSTDFLPDIIFKRERLIEEHTEAIKAIFDTPMHERANVIGELKKKIISGFLKKSLIENITGSPRFRWIGDLIFGKKLRVPRAYVMNEQTALFRAQKQSETLDDSNDNTLWWRKA